MDDITKILEAIEPGKPWATELLLPLVYEELRRLARQRMAGEVHGGTLQPTALVHEAFFRLVGNGSEQKWENRGHFYGAAAEAMRRILIESARRRKSLKRGGALKQVELSDELELGDEKNADLLLALSEALERLQNVDSESYKVVMLRYFGGLTVEESALSLGVSERTVKRNWAYARAWLLDEMNRE